MTDRVVTVFDGSTHKYNCCCRIDAKTGALIVAFVTIFQLTMYLLELTVFVAITFLVYDVSLMVTWGVAVAFLLYSLRTEKAVFCVPFIICSILWFIISIISITISTLAIVDPTSASFPSYYVFTMSDDDNIPKAAKRLIVWTIAMDFLLDMFFAWVVYKYYSLFRDQRLFNANDIATVQYTSQTPDTNETVQYTTLTPDIDETTATAKKF